jgi:hypothetical protein
MDLLVPQDRGELQDRRVCRDQPVRRETLVLMGIQVPLVPRVQKEIVVLVVILVLGGYKV